MDYICLSHIQRQGDGHPRSSIYLIVDKPVLIIIWGCFSTNTRPFVPYRKNPRLVHVSTVRCHSPRKQKFKVISTDGKTQNDFWAPFQASPVSIRPCVTGLSPQNGTVPFDSCWSIAAKSRIRRQWV
jgi:hypothetical protein